MANKKAYLNLKSPRQATAKSPKYEKPGVSLIETFNLTKVVREMRLKGKSVREISDFVNERGLIPNDYKISYTAVYRYCQRNGLGGSIKPDAETQVINTYGINCQALDCVQKGIDVIMVRLDEIEKSPYEAKPSEISQLLTSLDRMTLRAQTLSASIGEMQEKVFSYQTVEQVIATVMAVISTKVDDNTYEDIKAVLREDPVLCESLKMIVPVNKR